MIKGKIVEILNQKDNDWGRYRIKTDTGEIMAVGIIPKAVSGINISLEGKEENTKYGKQYTISHVIYVEQDKMAGVRMFLSNGYVKGIGKATAEKLAEQYGSGIFDILEDEISIKQLVMVNGITENKLESIHESYIENKKYRDIVIVLNGNVTKKQAEKIYEKYGEKAAKKIKENPYRLQRDISGFGFAKTDAIALSSGVKRSSIYRVRAAIEYLLQTASIQEGHCFLYMSDIRNRITDILAPVPKFDDVGDRAVKNAIKDWYINRNKFIKSHDPSMDTLNLIDETIEAREEILSVLPTAIQQEVDDGLLINEDGKIYTLALYNAETTVSKLALKMVHSKSVRFIDKNTIENAIKKVEARKGFLFVPQQRQAVYMCLTNRISIITGGPGRGKTAISEACAEGFIESGADEKDIVMLAPTGRAAQRITESTGYYAETAQRFVLSKDRPVGKFILCDESSMGDIYLVASLLRFSQDNNITFVGDVNQIASVGPGKVLSDLINSNEIPCTFLTEGHRNSGTIAHNSILINEGKLLNQYCYDDAFTYKPSTHADIQNHLIQLYLEKLKKYKCEDIMVCAAMTRGPLAVPTLNNKIHDLLNGNKEYMEVNGCKFSVNDRVMQLCNDYDFVKVKEGKQIFGVFNGEKGTIVKIDKTNNRLVVRFDDNSLAGYSAQTLHYLTLAYVTTLHKSQGSEAPCVIIGLTYGDYILLNRGLFYTAVTRAKKEVSIIAEEKVKYGKLLSAVDIAVKKTDDKKRNTYLMQRLME